MTNAETAKKVGQGRAYQDATHAHDAMQGSYDGGLAKGAKPKGPGPGPLPNTPSPMKITR